MPTARTAAPQAAPQLAADRHRGSHRTMVGPPVSRPRPRGFLPQRQDRSLKTRRGASWHSDPREDRRRLHRPPGPQSWLGQVSTFPPVTQGHTQAKPPRGQNDRQTPPCRARGHRRPPDCAKGLRLRPPRPHWPLRAETWPETLVEVQAVPGGPLTGSWRRPGTGSAPGVVGLTCPRAAPACVASSGPEISRRDGRAASGGGAHGDTRHQRDTREPTARGQVRLSTRPSSEWAARTPPPGPHRSGCTSSGGPNPESPSPRGSERKTWRRTCR